jgi:uncharacterized membrane protein
MLGKKKKIFYFLGIYILIILQINLVLSNSYYIIDHQGTTFPEQIVKIRYYENGTKYEKLFMTNSTSWLNINLPQNVEISEFKLIYLGKIYFNNFLINENRIKLRPIASLSGFVIDEKENLLKDIKLNIICSEEISKIPEKTNDIGHFIIEEVGLGTCEINLIKDNQIKTYEIILNESKEYSIKLLFPEKQKSFSWILVIFLIIVMVILIFVIYRFHKKKLLQKINKETKQFNKKQKDLMKTFSENENKIIEFLFFNELVTTQNKIRHHTNMPKSSLHRYLTKLNQKSIIKITEFGKLKKIELTDFFLKE